MNNFMMQLFFKFARRYKSVSNFIKKSLPAHPYRILSIEQDKNESYLAVVQLTSTRQIFHMNPEEILASDQMTDSFSQKDIRTLTYLGYLGINSPKYKILAKRLSENENHLIFALKERGNKNLLVKTASEISSDSSLLSNLSREDAHMIGYATGNESIINEKNQKQDLISQIK